MEHAVFVTASYAVSAAALVLLALWITLSARRARARVEALEKGASNRMDGGAQP
jgi:heme exporter protein CcmD